MEKLKGYKLTCCGDITRWDEGMMLGNGLIGILCYNEGNTFKFSLDRNDLWDTRQALETKEKDFCYEKMIQLVADKNQNEILRLFDNIYQNPYPTKLKAGRIEITFNGNIKNLVYNLDIYNALVTITFELDGKKCSLNAYAHSTSKLGFIKIFANKADFNIKLCAVDYSCKSADNERSLSSMGYPQAEYFSIDNYDYFTQNIFSYDFCIAVNKKKSEFETDLVINIDKINNANHDAKDILKYTDNQDYGAQFTIHTSYWRQFWRKSSLKVPNAKLNDLWLMGNYFFGCVSRLGRYPSPLQGVWTEDEDKLPPWKGDYHYDLNVEFLYSSYLKSNHIDEGKCFIEYLFSKMPAAKRHAETFYKSHGICMPGVADIDGNPLGGWPQYSLSPTMQIWLCQMMCEYYDYVGNDLDKIYDYLKNSAKLFEDILTQDSNGKLKLQLSTSPEINNNFPQSWLTPNTNFDLSLLRFLFAKLARYSDILKNNERAHWIDIFNKLDDYILASDGGFAISKDLEYTSSHRHLSHCMPIYPLKEYSYSDLDQKKIIDATILNIEHRGTGEWVGFSFTWMAILYAIAQNGEAAQHYLNLFSECMTSPNGFHLNGDYKRCGSSFYHYRPFTLEANMSFNDALQEMTLQNDGETLLLFPSLPKKWRFLGVEFKHFRAHNGLKVSAKIKCDKLEILSIKSGKDMTINVSCGYFGKIIYDDTVTKIDNNTINIKIKKGLNSIKFIKEDCNE